MSKFVPTGRVATSLSASVDTARLIDVQAPDRRSLVFSQITVVRPALGLFASTVVAAGVADNVIVVSVDGGCEGVRGVKDGKISATSQQYPLLMASMGVDAIVDYINTGNKVSGYTDTGVTLIADKAVEGVDSKDTVYGLEACWGE